ncbi:hypothetical protein AAHK20_27990 [Trinickia sp. YCB016]
MEKTTQYAALLAAACALYCASAAAQESLNPAQVRSAAHRAGQSPRAASEAVANPLLGAPRDYDDSYLSSLGVSHSTENHGSSRGGERRGEEATSASPLSPVLGAPEDYEDSYLSKSDSGRRGQASEAQLTSYRLTPVEQLASPDSSGDSSSSSEDTAPRKTVTGSSVVSLHGNSQERETATNKTNLSAATSLRALSGQARMDPASAIYRSPW